MSPRWVEIYQPKTKAAFRLFCFPCAGGAAQMFKGWSEHLPRSVEVCAIQLPGRWSRLREPLLRRVPRLIEAVVPNLLPFLDRPFALFGHSLGGLVAFEVVRALRRASYPLPRQLFVSAHRAAHLLSPASPLYLLPEKEFIDRLANTYKGIPEEVLHEPDLLELLLPAIRADVEMFDTYEYSSDAPLACSLTVFGGVDDPIVTRPYLEPWREHTTGLFSLEMFPGGHFFLNSSKEKLLQRISELLSTATDA